MTYLNPILDRPTEVETARYGRDPWVLLRWQEAGYEYQQDFWQGKFPLSDNMYAKLTKPKLS